jgi:hypothetical protein
MFTCRAVRALQLARRVLVLPNGTYRARTATQRLTHAQHPAQRRPVLPCLAQNTRRAPLRALILRPWACLAAELRRQALEATRRALPAARVAHKRLVTPRHTRHADQPTLHRLVLTSRAHMAVLVLRAVLVVLPRRARFAVRCAARPVPVLPSRARDTRAICSKLAYCGLVITNRTIRTRSAAHTGLVLPTRATLACAGLR